MLVLGTSGRRFESDFPYDNNLGKCKLKLEYMGLINLPTLLHSYLRENFNLNREMVFNGSILGLGPSRASSSLVLPTLFGRFI